MARVHCPVLQETTRNQDAGGECLCISDYVIGNYGCRLCSCSGRACPSFLTRNMLTVTVTGSVPNSTQHTAALLLSRQRTQPTPKVPPHPRMAMGALHQQASGSAHGERLPATLGDDMIRLMLHFQRVSDLSRSCLFKTPLQPLHSFKHKNDATNAFAALPTTTLDTYSVTMIHLDRPLLQLLDTKPPGTSLISSQSLAHLHACWSLVSDPTLASLYQFLQ